MVDIQPDKHITDTGKKPSGIDPSKESETRGTEEGEYNSCAWDQSLAQEQIEHVKAHFGPLVDALSKLAQLVREIGRWRVEPDPEHPDLPYRIIPISTIDLGRRRWLSVPTDIYPLVFRALTSARWLRPKIEAVLGKEQAASLYDELCVALSFHDNLSLDESVLGFSQAPIDKTLIALGTKIRHRDIADTLEILHRNLLLLIEPDATDSKQEIEHNSGLTQAERAAYQSYNYAISKEPKLADTKDNEIYNWLKENGITEEYELPSRETWKRQVRSGRKHHGTQKNTPRAGRTSRSIVTVNQIKYTSSQKAD